jgi:DNA primase
MDELERFKTEINLADVASAHGYVLDKRESSRSSLVMRHPDGDKIVVATGEDGHGVFFSVHTNASGSVIDFVMHRRHVNLGQARQILRDWLPQPVPFSFPTAPRPRRVAVLPKPQPIPRDRAALIAQWHRFAPYGGGYLESRGLTAATLAVFADKLRLDARGNVAFRHDDRQGLAGWELKNRGFTGFARGGAKALFAGRVGVAPHARPPRVIVAESAIDALSFYQAHPAPGLYLSFAGGLSPEQRDLLAHVLARYPAAAVVAATDADAQGEDFAALIQALRPDARRARPPVGKDWNDAIRPPARAHEPEPR